MAVESLTRQSFSNQVSSRQIHAEFIAVTKQVRQLADFAKATAKKLKLGRDSENQAAAIRLRVERAAGKYLSSLSLKGGDHRSKWKDSLLTLSYLGLDRELSKRWQQLALASDEDFQRYLNLTMTQKRELSAAAVIRLAKQRKLPVDPVFPLNRQWYRSRCKHDLREIVSQLHNIYEALIETIRSIATLQNVGRSNASQFADLQADLEWNVRNGLIITSELREQLKRLERVDAHAEQSDFGRMLVASAFHDQDLHSLY